jgi:tyrosyl-tRNA synthetase
MSGRPRDLVAVLRERGLVHQVTDEALGPLSAKEPITAYNGFDPSTPSLHAGSLYPVMLLAHAARCGHRPIFLLGGGTGRIGDPSGKEVERPVMAMEEIAANVSGIKAQTERLFEQHGLQVEVLDNEAWLADLNLVEFLRDTGKHFTVNWMMAKDSVRARLEDREQGISFTEFSYMLLQAYDFLRLYEDRGCRLQTGGSDQWGNITAGIELIRRRKGVQAFGLTCPLLLTPDGKKFGKSAGNAVWLDAKQTSPYRFFQFWMNQEDAQAAALLAPYTFLPMEEVAAVRAEAAKAPEKRAAQRRLAREATTLVHGKDAADRAERVSRFLFGEIALADLDEATLDSLAGEISTRDQPRSTTIGVSFSDCGLVKSGGEFKRLLVQGAIYVNDVALPRDTDPKTTIGTISPLFGRYHVERRGKKDYALVRVVEG